MRAFLLTCAVACIVACQNTTGPTRHLQGTYELRSVNGVTLPAHSSVAGGITLTAGRIVITSDTTFTFTQSDATGASGTGGGPFVAFGDSINLFAVQLHGALAVPTFGLLVHGGLTSNVMELHIGSELWQYQR